jgi:hypothetical protein
MDLETEAEGLREAIAVAKGQKRAKLIKRLRVIDNFIATGSKTRLDGAGCNSRDSPLTCVRWCSWMGVALQLQI